MLYVEGLKHYLLGIIQLCHKGIRVISDFEYKNIQQVRMMGNRVDKTYMINLDEVSYHACYLIGKEENSCSSHCRIAHIHMDHLNKQVSKKLVNGLSKIKFENEKVCDACQKGKQVKVSFKSKNVVSTTMH